jgi:hypothetical protein
MPVVAAFRRQRQEDQGQRGLHSKTQSPNKTVKTQNKKRDSDVTHYNGIYLVILLE